MATTAELAGPELGEEPTDKDAGSRRGPGRRRRRNPTPTTAGTRWYRTRVGVAGLLIAAVCVAAAMMFPWQIVGAVLIVVSLLWLVHRPLFSWTGLLSTMVAVILFIPVRRFKLPIPLSFALEPYRFILVALMAAIFVSLLVDPRFSWRRAGFGGSVGFFLATLFCSLAVNVGSLSGVGLMSGSVGALLNYVFLFGVFFVTRVLIRSAATVRMLVTFLTLGGAFVGAAAAVERVTRVNIFLRIPRYLGLTAMSDPATLVRGGGVRSFGSAQHPIALGVFLTMLIPLAVYQARHAGWPSKSAPRQTFWVGCALLMMIGVICTASRTSFVMLGAMVVVAVWQRPALFGRLILVGIPAGGLASLVAPSLVLNMARSFFNPSSLIATQYADAGWRGSGRLADLGPNLVIAMQHPFFGTGVGSRIVTGPSANALILDDQLLGTLLEAGLLGLLGILVLILGPAARLWRFGKSPTTPSRYTDLAVALSVAMIGYLVSLFFFDGFGFLQTVMVFCIMLAIGGWLITEVPYTRRRVSTALRSPVSRTTSTAETAAPAAA